MRKIVLRKQDQHNRRGALMPLIAVLLAFLLISLVFSVDIAYMQLSRTQLRAAVDAAARAGAAALAQVDDPDLARQAAVDAAAENEVAGRPMVIDTANIKLGRATEQTDGTWQFEEDATPYTSVRVTGIKDDATGAGTVPLFFAKVLGADSFSPQQTATASQFAHEIVLCVDRSHSMCFDLTGDDWVYPASTPFDEYCQKPADVGSRWASLEVGIQTFITSISTSSAADQQKVGLVTWGAKGTYWACGKRYKMDAAITEVGLSSDFNSITNAIVARGEGTMMGGTNMKEGLKAAVDLITGPDSNPMAAKTIILFTDGMWNQGGNPTSEATKAAEDGIVIEVVSFLDNVSQTDLDTIAQTTGGTHFNASTEEELKAHFDKLARNLPVTLID